MPIDARIPASPDAPLSPRAQRRTPQLYREQVWLVRLRWVAGLVALLGGLINLHYLQWYRYEHRLYISLVGGLILAYNLAFWLLLRRWRDWSQAYLRVLAWLQILLDLGCLTVLMLCTDGYRSPLSGLYVLHMVFASLLLPRRMAFAVAATAIAMVQTGLALTNRWPGDRDTSIVAVGWGLSLLATVYLANRITRSLRENQRRMQRQNHRIRAMGRRLRRQQQALIQQEKMVAMGQMAAGVAHEIANPLASMDGLLQLLERKPERITPENLTRLREQVSRIGQIVRQLTTFAHPGEQAWQSGSLNDVVTRAMNVIRFDRRLNAVTVVRELDPALPACPLQPTALEQVVINLVINALDAMENARESRLSIRTRVAGEMCQLEIHDTGHGIPPENLARLFEPFFTTKPVGKGTGLGLSISYSIVRKHGGTIQVQSEVGRGTTFLISLPQAQKGARSSQEREGAERDISTSGNQDH